MWVLRDGEASIWPWHQVCELTSCCSMRHAWLCPLKLVSVGTQGSHSSGLLSKHIPQLT